MSRLSQAGESSKEFLTASNQTLLLLLLLAIFVLDYLTPLGYAVWILYLLPVTLAPRLPHPQAAMVTAAVCSGLIVLGYFFSPPGTEPRHAIFIRAGGVTALWITTLFLLQRKRAEALLGGQKQVLEMIASGASLSDSLAALVRLIESNASGMLCSILLLDEDGVHVRHGAAPTLPSEYVAAIDGQPIGPRAGSCGTAAFRREPVFVEDIATDPLWADYRAAVLPHGLRACWSTPIFDAQRNVLGTFAMYYHRPALPQPQHLRLIDIATHTAAIGISRKRTEEALRRAHDESEQRVRERTRELAKAHAELQSILDASTEVAIIAGDPNKTITVFNSGAEKMLGYTAEEIIGKHTPALFHLESEVRAREMELTVQMGRPIKGGDVFTEHARQGGSEEREWTYVRKDGRHLTVNLIVTAIRDPEGRILSYLGIATDITARKRAERALQETNAELDAFAYTVSHDLRAPLRALQGFAQALIEDYGDRLDSIGQNYATRIVAAATRMDALIEDLLAYSRLSRTDIHLRPVNLDTVLTDVQTQLQAAIQERRAKIAVEQPLPTVLGHAPTLAHVLSNLLTNALKFVEKGVSPQVAIRADSNNGRVRVWVEDNGIGIALEHQERIFRVFERLHGSETYPGTGIGLAIVRKGVERMGGRSGVESEVGKGSRFWIELREYGSHGSH